jgi:hypothetical protein
MAAALNINHVVKDNIDCKGRKERKNVKSETGRKSCRNPIDVGSMNLVDDRNRYERVEGWRCPFILDFVAMEKATRSPWFETVNI